MGTAEEAGIKKEASRLERELVIPKRRIQADETLAQIKSVDMV